MATRGRAASLSLYRGILRAHKKMPMEMKLLGDKYAREEFKLHKSVTNEGQLDAFFVAWEQYLDQIMQTVRRQQSVATGALDEKEGAESIGFGKNLPSELELSDEQKQQLDKLKEEASQSGR